MRHTVLRDVTTSIDADGTERGREIIETTFHSWGDYLTFIDAPDNTVTSLAASRKTPADGWADASWYGTRNWKEAMRVGTAGWPEGTGRCINAAAPIMDRVMQIHNSINTVYDVTGKSLDVARYIDGDPEHWADHQPVFKQGSGSVMKIIVQISASAKIKPEIIMNRGAAIYAFVTGLERAGVMCELWTAQSALQYSNVQKRYALVEKLREERGGGTKYKNPLASEYGPDSRGVQAITLVKIKGAGDFVDNDRLAFAFAHPSMLRRFDFAVSERVLPHLDSGYGQPSELPGLWRPEKGEYDYSEFCDLYLPGPTYENEEIFLSTERTNEWVGQLLKAQGVILPGLNDTETPVRKAGPIGRKRRGY